MEKIANQIEGCCDKMKEMFSNNPGMKQKMQNCMDQFFDSEQTKDEDKDSSDKTEDSKRKACC